MRGQYIKWGGTLKGWGRGGCTETDLLPFKTLISKAKFSFAAPVHSCTFSIEVEGKSCQKYWLNSSYVIMFFLYIFFFSDHCVSICTETKKNLTLGTLTDWTVKTLQKLYLNTNEPMKVNMMKVNMPPPPSTKKKNQKRTTTTKLFVKPLKKEGAKSNKKTANFWAKN